MYGDVLKIENRTAEHVAGCVAENSVRLPNESIRSLTWDQGKEMATHAAFNVATGVPVYLLLTLTPRGSEAPTRTGTALSVSLAEGL